MSSSYAGDQTVVNPVIDLDQRHSDTTGGDFLKLGYALKGNDQTGNPGGRAGGPYSFDISGSEATGSDVEVISSTKYWAAVSDILHFNTNLDNPTGVKSVVVSEKIDGQWVDIASKTSEEIYGEGNTLPGSVRWGYKSLEDSIGRSTIFGENQLRIQSIYEDSAGTTHVSNSYYDRPNEGFINETVNISSSDSFSVSEDVVAEKDALTNVAVLGPNTSDSNSYTLEITAESLRQGWNLEAADIVLKYNSEIFKEITEADITLAGDLPVRNAISIDDTNGLIRFAAASLSDLGSGSTIFDQNVVASIKLDFDESYFSGAGSVPDENGKFTFNDNPLGFELSANSDETIFSRTFESNAFGQELGGTQSFDVTGSDYEGSDIEVISSTKYWAAVSDILHFNTNLDNPTGVKSVVVSEQIDGEWVDIASKTAEEIYGEGNTLPGSVRWGYKSLEGSIGRSTIFGENQLRIQSVYEDSDGTTHVSNSYYDRPDEGFINETVNINSSDSFVFSDETYINREIKSLGDVNGGTQIDRSNINLYQAEIKFKEQDGGLTFGTNRIIGANQGFTNLIRTGDTVSAQTSIENVGNSLAKGVTIGSSSTFDNAQFLTSRFLDDNGSALSSDSNSTVDLSGGVFKDDFSYDPSKQESINVEIDMKVTGAAGSVIDVGQGLFQVTASGMDQNPNTDSTPEIFVSESGSKNLITFQGDLNYDGRVSMKDLAYLNAGAARQVENQDGSIDEASVARDVDADFSGKIDLADLTVLDADWGKSLHTGDQNFQGSGDVSWTELSKQGTAEWDNSSFESQNAIEADDNYVGSLEAPVAPTSLGDNTSDNNDISGGSPSLPEIE